MRIGPGLAAAGASGAFLALPLTGPVDHLDNHITHNRRSDLIFVKKFTRPNFRAKEFYTQKTGISILFLPAINKENASLSVIWPSFG